MDRPLPHAILRYAAFAVGLAGICFLVGTWLSQSRATSERDDQESAIYDAGAVFAEDRPIIQHTFQVRNTSGRTIRLTDQLCACTCTTTKLSPAVLEPGQVGALSMSMAMTDAYADKTAMSCQLRFDDGTSREYALVYRLYPRIQTDREFLDFGTFSGEDQGPDPSVDLDVFLFAPPGRRLATLQSIDVPQEFEAERMEDATTTAEGGVQQHRYTVRVKAKPQTRLASGAGTFTKPIRFMADDGTVATASLIWRQSARFRCSPSPVSFGVVDRGGPTVTRTVLITASQADKSQAEAIESDSPFLKATREAHSREPASGAVERVELSLVVPLDYQGDVISGKVEARMSDDQRSTVQIPWSAIVRRPRTTDAAAGGHTPSDRGEAR